MQKHEFDHLINKGNIDDIISSAYGVLGWVTNNDPRGNINSQETMGLACLSAAHQNTVLKAVVAKIWEQRKPNAEVFCQATDDTAYVGLMEGLVYADTAPAGIIENFDYLWKVFGVNVYARTAATEPHPPFDNPGELMEIDEYLKTKSGVALDPTISVYTDVLTQELSQVLANPNRTFTNIPVENQNIR